MKNKWVVFGDDALAVWQVRLPSINQIGVKPFLNFVRTYCEISNKEGMCIIKEIGGRYPFNGENIDYYSFVENNIRENGLITLFDGVGGALQTAYGKCTVENKISFYDTADMLKEDFVSDAGLLLSELSKDEPQFNSYFSKHISPFIISSLNTPNFEEELEFTVELRSDIWFPYVKNFMESKDLSVNYDNRELVNCHTPALNNFLSDFFKSIKAINGMIDLEEINGFGKHYKDLITDKGILI